MIELNAFSVAAAQGGHLKVGHDGYGMPTIQTASQTFKEKVLTALSYVPILKNFQAVTEYSAAYSKQLKTDNAQAMGMFLHALSQKFGGELTERAVIKFNVDLSGKTPLDSRTVSQIINQVKSMHEPSRAETMNASKMAGFRNHHNTCYANSALKFLIHSTGQEKLTSRLKEIAETSIDSQKKDVATKLMAVIDASFTKQEPVDHELKEFFSSLQKLGTFAKRDEKGGLIFQILGRQNDADEFLMNMLEALGISDMVGSPIGMKATKVLGDQQVPSSHQVAPYHQVYTSNFTQTVQQIVDGSLKDEFRTSKFRDSDKEYTEFKYTKQLTVSDIATLERFTMKLHAMAFDSQGQQCKAKFPNANFSNDISLVMHDEKTDEKWAVTFEPREAIIQRGDLTSGHYVAYTKDGENGWACHNDREVNNCPGIWKDDVPTFISYSVKDKVMLLTQEDIAGGTPTEKIPAEKNQPAIIG